MLNEAKKSEIVIEGKRREARVIEGKAK